MKKYNKIEYDIAASEFFLDAVKFFTSAGVKFINSRKEHPHCISIFVDDSIKSPMIITPFKYAMSRNTIALIYAHIIRNERFGGINRIRYLIKVLNRVIKEGYVKGCTLSYNIEYGKYTTESKEVIKCFLKIFEDAITHSLGGDTLEHFGDIYSLLGGENGTYHFLKEAMLATEMSIPSFDGKSNTIKIIQLPKIKCYTCKYCNTDSCGVRTCIKAATLLKAEEFGKNPNKYEDAHYSHSCNGLVSAVVDHRMKECADYIPRIK